MASVRKSNVRTLVFRNNVRYQNATSLQNSVWKNLPSGNAIRRWLRQFKDAGNVLRRKEVGRPRTSQEPVDRSQEVWTSYEPGKARMLKLFSLLQY
jgi:hypothetical protein